jgi:predicted DCC family thiol-disulfide oxidoreductase YuxK
MDILDRLRLREDQQIVVAADVAMEIGKTLPPKRGLVILQAWIMVPMAPSSTRMRSRAAASRAVRLGEIGTVIESRGFLCAIGTNAQQMADRKHEVRTVHV